MTTEQFYGPAPDDTAPDATGTPAEGPARRRGSRAARRLLVAALVLLLVLVLAFFGGGGWYFAGRIHEDALVVRHPASSYGQTVVAIGDGTVTIADPADEQPVLDGHAAWGVRWTDSPESEGDGGDGYGQLLGEGTGDDDVTRRLRVLSGDPPDVGDVVDLDRAAFPDDPEVALGVPVRDVELTSPAGTFPAWLADGDQQTWAVLVHGKGGDRAEMLRLMRSTVRAGLPSLAITYRNDAGVAPSDDGRYGYGASEWPEVRSAVRYAVGHGARDVVLVGASMGGGIVASYAEKVGTDPLVGVVLDAPMLDLSDTVAYGASQEPLPLFGHVPPPLTWVAQRFTTARFGLDWDAVDYLDHAAFTRVPTLVLHGDDDLTVPIRTSVRVAAAHPGTVELVRFPGAGHVASWNEDPDGYDAAVIAFLDRL